MEYSNLIKICRLLPVVLLLAGFASSVCAQDKVDKIVDTGVERNDAAKASQQRVNKIADETDKVAGKYKRELKVIDGLKVYNTLLQRQLDDQQAKLKEISQSIEEVAVIQRQIVPLMLRMLDGLGQFIELDVPFLLKERRDRVARLKATMDEADVTAAEKFRAVLEAFQIENEYGRTIEAYKGSLEVAPGNTQEVDFLRIGRIALLYQSVGGNFNGYWDQANRSWKPLTEPEYRNYIAKGLQIARKQIAPELIMVPVSAPEESK